MLESFLTSSQLVKTIMRYTWFRRLLSFLLLSLAFTILLTGLSWFIRCLSLNEASCLFSFFSTIGCFSKIRLLASYFSMLRIFCILSACISIQCLRVWLYSYSPTFAVIDYYSCYYHVVQSYFSCSVDLPSSQCLGFQAFKIANTKSHLEVALNAWPPPVLCNLGFNF